MFTATVVFESGKGYWFAEKDETRESVFIHIKKVKNQKYLHVGDRIQFNVSPNQKFPEKLEAVDVDLIGHCVARQGGAR